MALMEMPVAKHKPPKPEETMQIALRVPLSFIDRIDHITKSLGTDRSHLLRWMIAESLPVFEERAMRTEKHPRKP